MLVEEKTVTVIYLHIAAAFFTESGDFQCCINGQKLTENQAVCDAVPDFRTVAGNVCVHTGKLIHIGLHAELRPSACGDNFESVPVKAAENIDCIIRYCQIFILSDFQYFSCIS